MLLILIIGKIYASNCHPAHWSVWIRVRLSLRIHCSYVPRIIIHFGCIPILIHWRGSPAVGERCGKVLQIKEMIALNIISLRILCSLWHYRDSNILMYGYELVLT